MRHLTPSSALAAAAAALLLASPALAQRAPTDREHATILDVTPYAGVMMFGSYLDGPLGTSVRSRPAPIGGAQVSLGLSKNLSLIGTVGYSSGDLEVGVPVLGGIDVGSSSSWLYDAGVELRVPTTSNIAPFVQAGGGAITTRLSGGPVSTTSTNPAFTAGAGVDIGFGRTAALRLQVRDYVARYKSQDVVGFQAKGDVTNNVALSAGLRFSF